MAWVICLCITGAMVYFIYHEYRRERRIATDLLRRIKKEKENAERTTKEKQQLLSMVCHDIANALSVVSYAAALMKMEAGPAMTFDPELLDRLNFAAKNIDEIIKSVRMLEAVKQGRVSLTLQPVLLRDLVDKAERMFADRLAERRITLHRPPDELLDIAVPAEPQILSNHVLNNLLSNALKFSYEDSTVSIEVADDNGMVAVSVRDHGIGIPESLIPHLFDPSVRTTRPGLNNEPGTGFGLMTVKSFVDLFGGTISLTSTPEGFPGSPRGTLVTVCLRRAYC